MTKVTDAQLRTLVALDEHRGEFRRGYGKSAAALARRGLARRKFVSDDGETFVAKFAISGPGIAILAEHF
jgi:hypothetical protein